MGRGAAGCRCVLGGGVAAVSVEAVSWALNLAPVPIDLGGRVSSPCKFVLVGLANHAGPDGAGAFPSVATLMRYTGLSEAALRERALLAPRSAVGVVDTLLARFRGAV
jgi:hypothetical protein